MEATENQPFVILGVKIKPGPVERFKLENFALDKTITDLKTEAGRKINMPSTSLEVIHHGKILRDGATLQDSGVKNGEMIHVVKKKVPATVPPPPSFSDAELQHLNNSLRTLGCTPNALGWTQAMQLLNDETSLTEVIDQLPSLSEDCVALSVLHEVELLAALGANVQTMRRGANAYPELPVALRRLTRLVGSRTNASNDNVPTSGYAYSLEALSEEEDVEEDENEETPERNAITQEHLAAALQAATEAVFSPNNPSGTQPESHETLIRFLESADTRGVTGGSTTSESNASSGSGSSRPVITAEMFGEALTAAINRAGENPPNTGDPHPTSSRNHRETYATQLSRMHEMGLVDDTINIRALLISSGDVNAAINLVFSGAVADD